MKETAGNRGNCLRVRQLPEHKEGCRPELFRKD